MIRTIINEKVRDDQDNNKRARELRRKRIYLGGGLVRVERNTGTHQRYINKDGCYASGIGLGERSAHHFSESIATLLGDVVVRDNQLCHRFIPRQHLNA